MVICAELFASKLNEAGFVFETHDLDDGGTCISFPYRGKTTNLFFSGDDEGRHVALRTVFENCPADRVPDMLICCNVLNLKYRWLKFCIDGDNDIMVEDDAIVSPESASDECMELLVRTASILDEAKPTIMRIIYG